MGLLSTKPQGGGLLGGGQQVNPTLLRYLDHFLLGDGIQSTKDEQRARLAAAELAKAFEGAPSFGQQQTMPSTGLLASPRATEQNGLLSRSLQADPALQTTPTFGQMQRPDMESIAPVMAKAAADGVNINPYLGINEATARDRAEREPKVLNTGQSLQSYDPTTRQLSELYSDPVRGPSAPAGYRFGAGGNLEPIPGGPADLVTIDEKTKARRNDLLRRPPPVRARPKAPGATWSALPAGYAPVTR